jgi:hypothetical protein
MMGAVIEELYLSEHTNLLLERLSEIKRAN